MEKKELDSTLMTFEQWCKSKWGAQMSPLNPVRDWDKWQTACTQYQQYRKMHKGV